MRGLGELEDSQLAKDPLIAKALGATRLHLMASFQKMPYTLRDYTG
jgi:hypothetical protein